MALAQKKNVGRMADLAGRERKREGIRRVPGHVCPLGLGWREGKQPRGLGGGEGGGKLG